MAFYKTGANFEDRNAIRRHAEAGKTAAQISGLLQIEEAVVSKFMPQAKPKAKAVESPPEE